MHIIGHTSIGIIGYIITKEPLFIVGSLLPDIALIPNELRFKKFNKWNVRWKMLYDITHSLFFPLLFLFNIYLFISIFIHIIIDIPFHTSSFRWKPFIINRYKNRRKALLLSGGADSIACGEIEKDYDCIYFNYGQEYHNLEYPFAKSYAENKNKNLIVIEKEWHTDIENRNYYLISEIKKLGYDEVIIGTRNILPIFDRYKDSNWFNLKMYQYLFNIYVNMPLVGNFKFQVKNKIKNINYYSTEI